MGIKKISILLGVLIAIYVVVNIFSSRGVSGGGKPFSSVIKENEIVSLEISNKRNGEKIKINKNDNHWEMAEPLKIKAENATINNLISKIINSELNGPFTEKEKYYFKFEIYPDTSPVISLTGKNTKVSFLTGKANSDFNGTFIKFSDSNGIYELAGIMPYEILISSYEAMDKKIFNTNKEKAIKFIADYKNTSIEFVRENDAWSSKSDIEPETFINQVFNIEFERISNDRPSKKDILFKVIDNLNGTEELICQEAKDGFKCNRGEISFIVSKNAINNILTRIKSAKTVKLK